MRYCSAVILTNEKLISSLYISLYTGISKYFHTSHLTIKRYSPGNETMKSYYKITTNVQILFVKHTNTWQSNTVSGVTWRSSSIPLDGSLFYTGSPSSSQALVSITFSPFSHFWLCFYNIYTMIIRCGIIGGGQRSLLYRRRPCLFCHYKALVRFNTIAMRIMIPLYILWWKLSQCGLRLFHHHPLIAIMRIAFCKLKSYCAW